MTPDEFLFWYNSNEKCWQVDCYNVDYIAPIEGAPKATRIASGETLTSAAINAEIWLLKRPRGNK